MRQAGQCQLRHIGNIAIGEMTITTHSQHCAAPFQKNRTALDRHSVRSGRDDFKLTVT